MEWNKSSEHLPSFYDSVLVVIDQGRGPYIAIGERKQFPQVWDVHGYGSFPKNAIEYWMELPKLPEKGL